MMHVGYKHPYAFYKLYRGVELKTILNSIVTALSKVKLWDSSVLYAPTAYSSLILFNLVLSTLDFYGFLFSWLPRWLR